MKSKLLIILGFVIVFGSCSVDRKIARKTKRLKQYAQKHGRVLNDTIVIHEVDTFIVDKFHFDTINQLVFNETTLVVEHERVRVKYFFDTITNNIHHDVHIPTDTLTQPDKHVVVTEKIVNTDTRIPWWIIILLCIMGLIVFRLLWHKLK